MDFIRLMLIKSAVLSGFGLVLILGDRVFKRIKAGTRCCIWFVLLLAMLLPVGLVNIKVSPDSPLAGMIRTDNPQDSGSGTYGIYVQGDMSLEQHIGTDDGFVVGEGGHDSSIQVQEAEKGHLQDEHLQGAGSQMQSGGKLWVCIKYTVTVIWAVGVFMFLLLHSISFYSISSRHRKGRKAQYNGIEYFISEQAGTPFTMGVFKKRIILPHREYPEEYLKMILSHEMLHIKRYDIEGKLIAVLINALIWFNPVVWLIRGRYNRDIELACDEKLTETMSESERIRYGELLYSEAKSNISFAFGTFFVKKGELKGRIENILNTADRKKGYVLFGTAVIVGSIFIFNITVRGENGNSGKEHQAEKHTEKHTGIAAESDTETDIEIGTEMEKVTDNVTQNVTENAVELEIIVSDFGYQYYTGYLDECTAYRGYGDFVDKDYDGDGITDRVYRESETLNCRYRVEFGNGIVLDINKWNPAGTILRLESADLDNDGEQELVFINKCDSYTSNNSNPTIDLVIYDKDGDAYKEMALPFKCSENSAPKVVLDYEYLGEQTYNIYVAGYDTPFSYKIPDSDWVYGEYAYMNDLALPTNYQGIQYAYINREPDGDKLVVSFKAFKKGAMGRITLTLGYDNGLMIEQGSISK